MTRTTQEVRDELARKGITVSAWAVANGFNTALVLEVLKGNRQCIRGQSHRIAVALGLKEGEICNDPAKALDRRSAA